jgi:G3E family GTPase
MPKPESEKIPVTLVTGFLGSGKTTLLNHLLRLRGENRVAVIENEVGEINIDNSLVVENLLSKEDLVSMDRGCVCCSLRGDILKALKELYDRGEKKGSKYDSILLETTGLADPAPVAFTFFSNQWISNNFRLDAIVCLVDAQHINKHLEDASSGDLNEAVNQIAFADVVLLNKIDLVSRDDLEKARDLIRSINVTADVVEVILDPKVADEVEKSEGEEKNKGEELTWDKLIGINSFSIERALRVDPCFMDSDSENDEDRNERNAKRTKSNPKEEKAPTPADVLQATDNGHCGKHDGPCTTACADPELDALLAHQKAVELREMRERAPKRRRKKLHDLSGVGSVGIYARGALDRYRFNAFMRDLLSEKARDIFRSKGCLCIKGQEQTKFVFQGVHETVCFGPSATGWAKGEHPVNQIVFIGKNLDRRALTEGFRSCVWVPLPDGWEEYLDERVGRPYYVNASTGKKQWDRPSNASALVRSTESSHKQPKSMQPTKAAA